MKIYRGRELLFDRVYQLKTVFQRARGLMFRLLPLQRREALLFYKGDAIHMWFVFHPIKAVWMDKNWKVVDVRRATPFALKIYISRANAEWLLEVNESTDIKVGNRLRKSERRT